MSRASSFRERVAWSALSSYLMVFFLFSWVLPESWLERGNTTQTLLGLCALVLIMGAQWLGARLEAPRREQIPDEREQLIALKADRVGGIVTVGLEQLIALKADRVGGIVTMLGAAGVTAAALVLGYNSIFLANLVLAVLLVGQIAKTITQLYHFKAGA
jgi:hypothetical protein